MQFQTPLIPGTLVRRYKRFLADVMLDDGTEVTAHCANPGAMTGLKDPGLRVWLEPNDDPKKKLKYGWRLVELGTSDFVGIDTSIPNRVVKEALHARAIPEVANWENIRAEVKYGEKSRVDFLLSGPGRPDHYLEVKNAHLCRTADLAEFPDTKTERGARHLRELAEMCRQGAKATLFYLVQRTDCSSLSVAADIDPNYAQAYEHARQSGVEVLCYGTKISPEGVTIGQRLSVI